MNDAELTDLALRAGSGDRGAATEFIRRTYQQVWRVLVVLSDRGVAEDLTQETFARAFRALPGFRAESSARSWLLAIARRVAADHLRTAARRPRTDPSVDLETVTVHDADQSESVVLRTLVADLEADRRLAFELTQVLGLSYTEAAVVCQCPIGTIRSRVARARDELVQALAEQDGAVAGRRNAHG